MQLRPALHPPALDPAQVDRLTALVERVIAAIDGARPTRELIAHFNADAGTQLTQFDFHSAASTERPRDFVERVLTRVPTLADLTDREAVELVRRLKADEGTARERFYWLTVLVRGLGQPGVADLIQHPGQQLSPEEVVQIARTCTGTALARYLSPLYRGYHVARALLRRLADRRLLALKPGASIDELARGAAQFLSREHPSERQIAELSTWLVEQSTVEELFADDAQLAQHLARV